MDISQPQSRLASYDCKPRQPTYIEGGVIMVRNNAPTIPDDKLHYFREQLIREMSHMFKWENLPQTVPQDYLERVLIRHGYVLFYEDENIGLDVLMAEPHGYNRHNQPVTARTFTPTTNQEVQTQITRNIKRLTDSENAIEHFDPINDGVLINNMEYGKSAWEIVEHFSYRLALTQQAFDTNLMWANVPYIFQTGNEDTRLSIERMFKEIFTGKPFIIADEEMFKENHDRTGVPSGISYIGDILLDTHNEIMMKFRQTIGIDTAGVDKAERTNTLEIESNTQHTKTVLEIMKQQRDIACENINAFFNTNIKVITVGEEDQEYQEEQEDQEGDMDNGTGDS